jgi:hypothetical protein
VEGEDGNLDREGDEEGQRDPKERVGREAGIVLREDSVPRYRPNMEMRIAIGTSVSSQKA